MTPRIKHGVIAVGLLVLGLGLSWVVDIVPKDHGMFAVICGMLALGTAAVGLIALIGAVFD